jgi:anti-sigma factor RsiW
MVTGTHPEDVDLFDYVEGDLAAARLEQLEAHLASCAQCAEHVAMVRAGRDVLQESQLLELSPQRREAILASLPERHAQGRRFSVSPKRALAVLVPVAAVGAVVAAIVTTGDFGMTGSGGGGVTARAEAAATSREATGGGAASAPTTKQAYDTLLTSGSAEAVARDLRAKGIKAKVVGHHVEVRGATRAEVEQALGKRRTGSVRIVFK